MSYDPRMTPPLFGAIDVTADPASTRILKDQSLVEELAGLMREMCAKQDRNNKLLEDLVAHMVGTHRQRAQEIGNWKQANPALSDNCRVAAETLSKVQTNFLETLTTEVNENADCLMDGEFMLNEFVDRFGPRLAHLNGVLQVLSQLSSQPAPAANAAESS
jgi:hypothetical protein